MSKIKRILVSQPTPKSKNPFEKIIKNFQVEVEFLQLIKIEGLTATEFRQQKINPLDFPNIIFNSTLAVDHFFRMCKEMRITIPNTTFYYCVSESIANYLQKYIEYRKRKIFFSTNNDFEDVFGFMEHHAKEKFLLVASDKTSKELIRRIKKHGIVATPAVMYRTVMTEWPKDKPFNYDMVVLFTPTGADALHQNFASLPNGCLLAAFGSNTIRQLEKYGYNVAIKAPTKQYTSIISAIEDYLEKEE